MIASAPQNKLGMSGGMDYTTLPHLLPPTMWRMLFNMRENNGLKQVPRKVVYLDTATVEEINGLASVPTGYGDYAHWLAFTPTKLLQLISSSALQQLNSTAFTGGGGRWSLAEYNNSLVFVNDTNPTRVFRDGRLCELYDMRSANTTSVLTFEGDNGPQLGTGPFCGEPLYTGNDRDEIYPGADLGTSFTWTLNHYYRVYCEKPHMFERDATVSIVRESTGVGVQTLTGVVIEHSTRYVVLKATNTVASVSNTLYEPPWRVTVTWMNIPQARYCAVFFDHLLLGAPTIRGKTLRHSVAWSHLGDWANWTPGTDSEADTYLCTDYQRPDDIFSGVTGVHVLHDLALIFTPSCIYAMDYVGLPRVVRVRPLIQDFGNALRYSSVSLDNAVAWLDAHNENFYIWRGQGPEAIGGPISSYFFNDISLSSSTIHDTFAYVDRRNSEVVWVYKSTASAGTFDKAVAFNFANKTWSVRSVEGTTSFARFHRRAKLNSQLSGTCAAQTGTAIALEQSSDTAVLMWGTNDGKLLREAVAGDANNTLLSQTAPYLETGDLIYGSSQKVKEVSAMNLNVSGTFTGVAVSVSGRQAIHSTVTYTACGTWTTALPEIQLTFTPVVGQVLRYKFTFTGTTRDTVFYGFDDNLLTANADR